MSQMKQLALDISMAPGPTLMFEGHTDVVTEGDPTVWRDPPFAATIRDGRIYGRGANDMKAGLVAALVAIKAIVASGARLNGTLLLGAVCDEEGDMIGIKHFVARGWADEVSAAIVCAPLHRARRGPVKCPPARAGRQVRPLPPAASIR